MFKYLIYTQLIEYTLSQLHLLYPFEQLWSDAEVASSKLVPAV